MKKSFVLFVLAALAALTTPALERQEIRIPDLPGFMTLKCDLHMHTVFSDGAVWPSWRVEEAWRDGLDAIALTDHIEYVPKRDDVTPNYARPYDLSAGAGLERGLIVIRGAEITKAVPPGHFNVLFVTNIAAVSNADVTASLEAAKAQGAFAFWNHPGWRVKEGDAVELPIHDELCAKGLIQGIEIYNGDDIYTNAWPWAEKHGLTLLANSDTHTPVDPPVPYHAGHRTMTLVFAKERTSAAIREALLAGRTAVWAGSVLAGRPEHLEPLVRACITLDPPHHKNAKTMWVHLHNRSDFAFSLARTAGPGPKRIDLPAGKTVLLKLSTGSATELGYTVENALVGPARPLSIAWPVQ